MQDQEETGGPLWTCGEMILKVQAANPPAVPTTTTSCHTARHCPDDPEADRFSDLDHLAHR